MEGIFKKEVDRFFFFLKQKFYVSRNKFRKVDGNNRAQSETAPKWFDKAISKDIK